MKGNKYLKALTDYTKQSGAFEWAAKQYHADMKNEKLRNDFLSNYSLLSSVYYPQIELIYKDNPNDFDAISIYDIARVDFQLMTFIYNNILNIPAVKQQI